MADSSVAHLKRSFELHLRAENKAVRTIETYLDVLRLAAQFLGARGVELEQAGREDEAFIADQLARWKPATATNRYRSLRVFYGWLEAEGEIPVSPMTKMRPPAVPDQPVPLVHEDAFRRLLEASAGRDFEARRDTALVLLLVDVGPRRAEIAGMRLTDLDFDLQVALVLGKGGRQRAFPFGRRPPRPLTAISASAPALRILTWSGCGLASSGASPSPASLRSSAGEVTRPGWKDSTRTSSSTRSPTCGCPRVATRLT